MLDQCHNIEAKIPGQIRSVLNVQEMTARALLVDHGRSGARRDGDVLARERDVHGRLLHRRPRRPGGLARGRGLPARPDAGLPASGYQEEIEAARVGGTQAGWN